MSFYILYIFICRIFKCILFMTPQLSDRESVKFTYFKFVFEIYGGEFEECKSSVHVCCW